jgi:2',3'-cyclic-nucleotide 2'-phosphodiesterase/3'-nucleotidase
MMKKMTALRFAFVALLAGMLLVPAVAQKKIDVTIIETTDIHGAFFPYDFKTGKPKDTSLAQVSALVKEKRASGEVLLLDDGDLLQGQPIIYYYNFMNAKEKNPASQMLNYMKYDVVGVGNHDIETGHDVYDKFGKELAAGYTCANIVKKSNGEPYFTPYRIIRKGGLKIAVLGLTEPAFVKNFPQVLYAGNEPVDMVAAAKKWVPIIQQKEKPDVIIGLFHSGVDYTYGGYKKESANNENPSQLVAEQVEGFDLILVGHDHQGWDGQGWDPVAKAKVDVKSPSGKIVPIFGGLDDVRKVPVITLSAVKNAKGKYDVSFAGSLVDVKTVAADKDFLAKFASYETGAKTWLAKEIGSMEGSINTRESMFGDSAFVDLIHDLQLQLSRDPASGLKPAQISFCAPLSGNSVLPSRADGKITVADMFTLYKYENWLYTMDLTGAQVDGFLEDSYANWFGTMATAGDHLINFSFTADGKLDVDARTNLPRTKTASYNYDSAQGINYTVDVSKPAGDRVAITTLADGTAFDPAKTYSVAINSYRAMGGGGLLERGAKISSADLLSMKYVTSATTRDLRYYLTEWFEKNSANPVKPVADKNWKVVPEDFAAAGAKTDNALMYP